jgi:hypothetical protein
VASTALWEATFRRVVDRMVRLGSETTQALEQYVLTRRAVERNEFATLSVAKLQAFRAARQRFTDPAIEALFRTWMASGATGLDLSLVLGVLPRAGHLVRTLPHGYEQFGAFCGCPGKANDSSARVNPSDGPSRCPGLRSPSTRAQP